MSTEAALLRAIREHPDEDTPRLVYADWLDENDQPERAEFIRVQVERSRLPEYDPRRFPLEDREHELLAEHETAWLGVARDEMDGLVEWEFERGFFNEIAATPYFMRVPGADLCAAHPVRRWRVQGAQDNMEADLREASHHGWFARLVAIDFGGWFETIGQLGTLFSQAEFPLLHELDLTGLGGLPHLPIILGRASFRDRLRILRCSRSYGDGGRLNAVELVPALGRNCRLEELSVPYTRLRGADLRDLLEADCCRELQSLTVRDNEIPPDAWEAFCVARCRLRELDVSTTPLGAIALDRLLGCASTADLRRLHMNGCGSAMANLRALASSRFWTQAEELRIREGSVPEHSLEPLFTATGSPALRVLDAAGNWLRDRGVAQLCEAPWAGSLAYLDLSQNLLTDEALRTMVKSGRFKNLHTLHLNFNSPRYQEGAENHERITDAGLRALAECPDFANLRVLSVSGTHITAAGVDAILNAPHWRLTALRLSQCQLSANAVEILAASPPLSRLEVLDLSNNGEYDIDLAPLAESEHLSPRTELDIRGVYVREQSTLDALRERLGQRLN